MLKIKEPKAEALTKHTNQTNNLPVKQPPASKAFDLHSLYKILNTVTEVSLYLRAAVQFIDK